MSLNNQDNPDEPDLSVDATHVDASGTDRSQTDASQTDASGADASQAEGVLAQRLIEQLADVRHQLEDTRGKLEEMRQQALLDPLTGIGNRRAMNDVLDRRFSELYRYDSGFSLLAIDFDLLKSINDTHGHAAGDAVLTGTVQLIIADLRQADRLFRLGGDEFIALLPATPFEGAKLTAQRLCVAIVENKIRFRELTLGTTISIGVAEANRDDDVHSLIERADRLLYQAKAAGGNQVGWTGATSDSRCD